MHDGWIVVDGSWRGAGNCSGDDDDVDVILVDRESENFHPWIVFKLRTDGLSENAS